MAEVETGFRKNGGSERRNCHRCRSMDRLVCVEPVMVEFSSQPRDSNGMPYVDRDDICDFFRFKHSLAALLKEK